MYMYQVHLWYAVKVIDFSTMILEFLSNEVFAYVDRT